jgi:hypothetical protein
MHRCHLRVLWLSWRNALFNRCAVRLRMACGLTILVASCVNLHWARRADAQWLASGGASPEIQIDLDQLSDQELVDLYIATYEETLRKQVVDDATLVQPGRLLVQAGFTSSFDRDVEYRNQAHTLPELLIRYRALERAEFRLAWAGVTFDALTDQDSGISDRESQLADPSLGCRSV